jgi:hypothetical protein
MKIIPDHGIWNLLRDFLTKNRYLGKRTKIVLSGIIAITVIAGYFEPGIEGFYDWMSHRQGLYKSSHIAMPVFWTQDTWASWKRPSARMFSLNDGDLDVVEIGPNGISSMFLYTAKGVTKDMQLPEVQPLLDVGMKCRWNPTYFFPGASELWCVSADQHRVFHYTGARSYLPGAVSIIQQIH